MENTNLFTIVCVNNDSIKKIDEAFGLKGDAPESQVVDFFKRHTINIVLPEQFSFDHYQRKEFVVDASFTSGSTSIDDFMVPLSKITDIMYVEIIDDEISKSLKYGFINGEKVPYKTALEKMQHVSKVGDLGRAGKTIKNQKKIDNNKNHALLTALIDRKKASIIQELLEAGADANARDKNGESCLYHAIMNKSATVTELLIKHGADIASKTSTKGASSTYLFEACRFEAHKIVQLLLEHGADPNQKDGYFRQLPIQMAIENHMSKAVTQLIEYGAISNTSLLKQNADDFHSNNGGKLNKKLAIFKELLKNEEVKEDFINKKDMYLRTLSKNLKKMYPDEKDKQQFEKMYTYLEKIK